MRVLCESDLECFRTKSCSHSSPPPQQQHQHQQQHQYQQRQHQQPQCGFGAARCNYSHNTHWIRRCPVYLKEPSALRYLPYLCSNVLLGPRETIQDNCCPYGAFCPFAHSREELIYHPLVYKLKPCAAHRYGRCKAFYCWKAHGPLDIRIPRTYTIPARRNLPLPPVPGVTVVHSLAAAMAAAAAAEAAAAAAAAPAAPGVPAAPEEAQECLSAFAAAGRRRPRTQQLGVQQQLQQQQHHQQRRRGQQQELLHKEPQQRLQQHRMQRQLHALHCSWEDLPSLTCSTRTSTDTTGSSSCCCYCCSTYKGNLKSSRSHWSSRCRLAVASLAAALRSRRRARRSSVQQHQQQQQQHLQQLQQLRQRQQQQRQQQQQQQQRPRQLLKLHQMLQGAKRLWRRPTSHKAAARAESDWTPTTTTSSSSSSSTSSKESRSQEALKSNCRCVKSSRKSTKRKAAKWPERSHRIADPTLLRCALVLRMFAKAHVEATRSLSEKSPKASAAARHVTSSRSSSSSSSSRSSSSSKRRPQWGDI
ncbi:hypothetical protein ACSSS7_006158 [Eimeria intestinalis]